MKKVSVSFYSSDVVLIQLKIDIRNYRNLISDNIPVCPIIQIYFSLMFNMTGAKVGYM